MFIQHTRPAVPPGLLYNIQTKYDSQGLEQIFILGSSAHKYQQTSAYTTHCILMLNVKLLQPAVCLSSCSASADRTLQYLQGLFAFQSSDYKET